MSAVQIYSNSSDLARASADHFIKAARQAISEHGRFSVALGGGSTPKAVYKLLVEAPLDWEHIHVFWGDERSVPPDHPDSNYRMARQTFLDHVPIPPKNIHRIQGELNPETGAEEYERELRAYFTSSHSQQPSATGNQRTFDLVLLGMGNDGHTASLFPGTASLDETRRWVVPVPHSQPPPPLVDRVSLTFPAINAAARVIFIVAGASKAARLKQVISHGTQPELPAQMIKPASGHLLWLVDQAAASQ